MKHIDAEMVLSIINANVKNVNLTMESLDNDLIELGMDSVSFIQMIVVLEDKFQCEIPESQLLISEMNTAGKIINVLQKLFDANVKN